MLKDNIYQYDISDIIQNAGLTKLLIIDNNYDSFLTHCYKEKMKKSYLYLIEIGCFQVEINKSVDINKDYESIKSLEQQEENKEDEVHVIITDFFNIMRMDAEYFISVDNIELPSYTVEVLKDIGQIDICFSNGCKLIYQDYKSPPSILINKL